MNIICFYLLRSIPGSFKGRLFTAINSFCLKVIKQKINHLAHNLSKKQDQVISTSNAKIAEYFEKAVNILADLTTHTLKQKSWTRQTLSETFSCLDECTLMSQRIKRALEQLKQTSNSPPPPLVKKHILRSYCYCCSKPIFRFLKDRLFVVFDDHRKYLPACHTCHQRMQQEQSLNILHFVEKEQRKHWSQVDNYLPNWEFWQLNAIATNNQK
jgi:hypothetical protein